MKAIRAILIDDEPDAISGMQQLLKIACPEIQVCGTATNALQAISLVKTEQPDVVFLDVEMPVANGFELLEHIRLPQTQVVFVTAHPSYSIRALRESVDDYLLKPVAIDELRGAVDRIIVRMNTVKTALPGESFRVKIITNSEVRFYPPAEIICIKADGRYSEVVLRNQRPVVVTRNIGEFEQELQPYGFFRIHKSWLVNINEVVRILQTDGGFVELNNGMHIEISRRKKLEFMEFMKRGGR
ncbi:MAG: response regulator transcription factor [Bacteroidetes bacterium]|nr:response regulator transcription factor [Bacteroidota bacterium]